MNVNLQLRNPNCEPGKAVMISMSLQSRDSRFEIRDSRLQSRDSHFAKGASQVNVNLQLRNPNCEPGTAVPRLEPHLYTEDKYRKLKETVDRMTADGVVLFPKKAR